MEWKKGKATTSEIKQIDDLMVKVSTAAEQSEQQMEKSKSSGTATTIKIETLNETTLETERNKYSEIPIGEAKNIQSLQKHQDVVIIANNLASSPDRDSILSGITTQQPVAIRKSISAKTSTAKVSKPAISAVSVCHIYICLSYSNLSHEFLKKIIIKIIKKH